jgi:hypothetical protein
MAPVVHQIQLLEGMSPSPLIPHEELPSDQLHTLHWNIPDIDPLVEGGAHWDEAVEFEDEEAPPNDGEDAFSNYGRIVTTSHMTAQPLSGWQLRLHYYYFELYDSLPAPILSPATFTHITAYVRQFQDAFFAAVRLHTMAGTIMPMSQFLRLLATMETNLRLAMYRTGAVTTAADYDNAIRVCTSRLVHILRSVVRALRVQFRFVHPIAFLPLSRRAMMRMSTVNKNTQQVITSMKNLFVHIFPRNAYQRARYALEDAYVERQQLDDPSETPPDLAHRIVALERAVRERTLELLRICVATWEAIAEEDDQSEFKDH